jgi:hypothetical protein
MHRIRLHTDLPSMLAKVSLHLWIDPRQVLVARMRKGSSKLGVEQDFYDNGSLWKIF